MPARGPGAIHARASLSSLAGRHILSCDMFDKTLLHDLFELADLLVPVARGQLTTRILEGCILGSLFFEASTRTRLSFDSAFMRLGGCVSSTTGITFSSIAKGESLADTSRVASGYFDVLVVRHPEESSIHEMAKATNIPVLNGGNGAGEHPTQALLDLYTIRNEFARTGSAIDGSRVALVGDLRFGRTIHSLLRLLALYEGLRIICISPKQLELPRGLVDLARARGHLLEETDQLEDGLREAQLIYATRVQRERFPEKEAPIAYSSDFRIDASLVARACRADAIIMHPLPRDSREGAIDLSSDLDGDSRLAVFRQTDAGIPTRMALFASVMGVAEGIERSFSKAGWYRPAFIGPNDAPFYRQGKA
ncbi:MAG TPA: aspartate carbamoyltransferase [Usitatibacter sp.]